MLKTTFANANGVYLDRLSSPVERKRYPPKFWVFEVPTSPGQAASPVVLLLGTNHMSIPEVERLSEDKLANDSLKEKIFYRGFYVAMIASRSLRTLYTVQSRPLGASPRREEGGISEAEKKAQEMVYLSTGQCVVAG